MRAKMQYAYEPDYAVPPGQTLLEVMESLDLTQKEMAARTGLTVQSLNRIIKGRQPISYETAARLELVTKVPAGFWNNLEAQYQELMARLDERERMEAELDWLKDIPVKELCDRKVIPHSKDRVAQLREVLSFFSVSSVDAWKEVWGAPKVAARRSACFETRPGPASVWIRLGELQAAEIECRPYDKECFKASLEAIRNLTRKEPEDFLPKMRDLCAEAGVALALVPEMKKVPWNGATKWLHSEKAMILLSLRGKGEDIFWFSFFHEAGHVLKDNKKDLLINTGNPQDDPREQRADDFAAEFLIPKKNNPQIKAIRTKNEVRLLAEKLGVSSGIVAGRYRHLTKNWSWFKGETRTFNWVE